MILNLTNPHFIVYLSYGLSLLFYMLGWSHFINSPALFFPLSAITYLIGYLFSRRDSHDSAHPTKISSSTKHKPSHPPLNLDHQLDLDLNPDEDSPHGVDSSEWESPSLPLPLIFILTAIGLSLFYVTLQDFQYIDSTASADQLYSYGEKCEQENNPKCAQAIFERILEIQPMDLTALGHLGRAYRHLGEHQKAIEIFNRYFKQGGTEVADILYNQAESLLALGQREKAYDLYLQINAISNHYVDVTQRIIDILVQNKNNTEARAILEDHLKKNPQNTPYFKKQRELLLPPSAIPR